MTRLHTLVSLDHLHCHDEADGAGSGEPYLWTAFFKVDGETVVLDLVEDDRPDETKTSNDLFLRGTCTLIGSPGSHGNLPNHDVDAGDDVPVPAPLGELRFEMAPIPVTARAQPLLGGGTSVSGGAVGAVVALLEENLVSDSAAEAGHATFNDTLVAGINELIPNLRVAQLEPTPEQKAALKARVSAAVIDAMTEASGFDVGAWLDRDVEIGAELFLRAFGLTPWSDLEISQRFQRLVPVNSSPFPRPPTTVVAEDYTLVGEILGVEPPPLGHTTLRRSAEYNTPPAAGSPAACFVAPRGVQDIIYRDRDGRLHELWCDAAGRTGTASLTDYAGAPRASGDPRPYVDTVSGQVVVLYRGADNRVHSLYSLPGAVGHDDLSGTAGAPDAAGDPVGTHNPATNTTHVAYRGVDNQLHVLYWTGAGDTVHYEGPSRATAPGAFPAPPASGNPSLYFDVRSTNVLVYRADDGHIHSLYWSFGDVGHDDLSGYAGTPPAAGEPVAYYIAGADLNQVTYRSADGHLWELYCVGEAPVAGWDLIAATPGAPPSESDPAVYYNAGTNTKHVVYRSENDHLNEIWWVPGGSPAHVDLTRLGLARRAADTPAAFTVDGPYTQHVVYRSTDNEIREIRWPTRQSGWRWCNKCQGLFHDGAVAASRCPDAGTHEPPERSASPNYSLFANLPLDPGRQSEWRWCSNCHGLFYGGNVAASSCPVGGTHSPPGQSRSWNYSLPANLPLDPGRQSEWRWCNKCQGLFHGPAAVTSRCPAGGTHAPPEQSGSWDYSLPRA
jgi:hypothetical protein